MPLLELPGGITIPTLSTARRQEYNIFHALACADAERTLRRTLWDQRASIATLVRHHLGLPPNTEYRVEDPLRWIQGGFNLCIPVVVISGQDTEQQRVMFRVAMAHKVAEATYPGSVHEKVRCEVGMYAWMQENCRHIPIPHLYGFGLTDGRGYTHEGHAPWTIRAWRQLARLRRTLSGTCDFLSHYVPHPAAGVHFPFAYLILEYVGGSESAAPGERMLSSTWNQHINSPSHRRNLFTGLARLMLSLARRPQPHIGSLSFNADDCTVSLSNRPLVCATAILEASSGAPRLLETTYSCADTYASDVLQVHDTSFLHELNAAYDEEDCRAQMAARVALRAVAHQFIDRERRGGPFALQFTDLHASNIFVNDEWEVTRIVDLEWVCALPAEAMAVPYWVAGHGIDMTPGEVGTFDEVRREFMEILAAEEEDGGPSSSDGLIGGCANARWDGGGASQSLAQIMSRSWESGATWFWWSLGSVDAMLAIVQDHLAPRFAGPDSAITTSTETVLSRFWARAEDNIVRRKLAQREEYVQRLEELFRG